LDTHFEDEIIMHVFFATTLVLCTATSLNDDDWEM